jgi:precorrin-2 dehydrogenase/sirohydrochlorin ferrochelatase
MHENNGQDILPAGLEYMMVSLISSKTEVLVIGGGKAGFLKCSSFCKRGCSVTVVSPEFIEDFKELRDKDSIKLICDSYRVDYITNKHLIIIAVSDNKLTEEIEKDCRENYKLYLNCSDFRKGMFTAPFQRETAEMLFGVQTLQGNPKLSKFLGNKVINLLNEYDDFSKYVCSLREKLKKHPKKNEVLEFVCTDDFYSYYKNGVHEIVLEKFYGGSNNEFENCHKEE